MATPAAESNGFAAAMLGLVAEFSVGRFESRCRELNPAGRKVH